VRRVLIDHGYQVQPQVRILGKTIDLVGAKKSTLELVTVELKIRDWKRAVRQAYLNQPLAHVAYIAIHEKYIDPTCLSVLEAIGVGLISVGRRAEILLRGDARRAPNPLLAARLRAAVMDGQEDA